MSSKRDNRAPYSADHSARTRLQLLKRKIASLFGCAAVVTLALFASHPITAQSPSRVWVSEGETVRRAVITLNKSRTFRIDQPFATVVMGEPDIADARPISDRVIYIQGKKVGTTNLVAFDKDMKVIGVMDIEVAPDTSALQQKIASSGARGVHVTSSNGQIMLNGSAGSAIDADRAVSIAKSLVPQGSSVVNAMTVAPSQQVMLKVRFLEASRSAGRELGLNWFVANGSGTRGFTIGANPPAQVGQSPNPTPGGIPLFQAAGTLASGGTPFGVAIANLVNGGNSVDLMLTALETKGLIRRLAEPDLVALSGDTAAFLAGGEFPVPVVQPGSAGGTATVTIEFKPFGVQLTFMPTVLASGIINLRLAPSVSEIDPTTEVTIAGTRIPGLIKREARTTIELRDGQSFAIAGLLESRNRRDVEQVPWIGSVPVLGALFRSEAYLKAETDLVVIVTPHLVAPAVPGQKIATPFDKSIPTNDVDFFLLGQMEQSKEFKDYVTNGGGLNGPYGYLLRTDVPPSATTYVNPPVISK